jgi:type II secretory pathway component PulK
VHPKNNESGIALILVLWVMVLLIALSTEFALSMKTEVNTTRNFKEDAESSGESRNSFGCQVPFLD